MHGFIKYEYDQDTDGNAYDNFVPEQSEKKVKESIFIFLRFAFFAHCFIRKMVPYGLLMSNESILPRIKERRMEKKQLSLSLNRTGDSGFIFGQNRFAEFIGIGTQFQIRCHHFIPGRFLACKGGNPSHDGSEC